MKWSMKSVLNSGDHPAGHGPRRDSAQICLSRYPSGDVAQAELSQKNLIVLSEILTEKSVDPIEVAWVCYSMKRGFTYGDIYRSVTLRNGDIRDLRYGGMHWSTLWTWTWVWNVDWVWVTANHMSWLLSNELQGIGLANNGKLQLKDWGCAMWMR